MKRESLWMLLVTRIPREEEKQKEILAAFEEAFKEDRRPEYLTLLRASFMSPRDMETRAEFYRVLGDRLMEHLKKRPDLASGPHGLYIGFIAEDLARMADPGLAQAGRSLSMALRLATNPPAIRFTAEGTISLPACPVPVAEASANPEAWAALLIRHAGLWTNPQLASIRDQLAASPGAGAPGDLRRRSHALLVVGAHLENARIPDWPHGCYLAAAATDPTYDLPWAFLALIDPDPHSGLAAANQALVANPKSLPGFVNRGTVLGRLGRSEEALRDFAEAARYDQGNPRLLLQCAHAALESGAIETAVQVFLFIHRAFPGVPEAWYGLARLFWRAGLTDMAKRCQEKFTGLRHGNVPRELRLVGRLRVESRRGGVRVQVDQETGVTPWELGEVLTGEHRIAWENGPVRKVMVDEGESIRVAWCEGKEDVEVLEYTPEPTSWKQTQPDGTVSWVQARVVLAPYLVEDLDQMPDPGPLTGILARVPRPISLPRRDAVDGGKRVPHPARRDPGRRHP